MEWQRSQIGPCNLHALGNQALTACPTTRVAAPCLAPAPAHLPLVCAPPWPLPGPATAPNSAQVMLLSSPPPTCFADLPTTRRPHCSALHQYTSSRSGLRPHAACCSAAARPPPPAGGASTVWSVSPPPPPPTACCCSAESPGPSQVVKHERGTPLPAPIERIFYLSREGRDSEHEVHPVPNPVVLEELEMCDAIVYGMGSLYTSICPSLVLEVRSAANSLGWAGWRL